MNQSGGSFGTLCLFNKFIASFKLFFMLIANNSEWKYILAKFQSSSDFGILTPSLRVGNSSWLLFIVTKWIYLVFYWVLSFTILLFFEYILALDDLWHILRPQNPLHILPQIYLGQSLLPSLWSRLTVLQLFETLLLSWLSLFVWCLKFSLRLQLWRFKISKSFWQKLQITNTASQPIIVTLFITI